MIDSEAQQLAHEIARLGKRISTVAQERGFSLGVVTSVDIAAKTCDVMMQGDDTSEALTLTHQHGFLPKLGDSVLVNLNGADPFVLAPRTMVDGDMSSKDYEEGVAGWIIKADGDAEFSNVVVRGFVNGIKVHQPPLALLRGKSADYPAPIATSTWTTLTDLEVARSNARGTSGNSAYTVTYSSARIVPGRVGLWQVTAKVGWAINASGNIRRLQLINDDTSTAVDLDIRGPQGGLVMHSVHEPVEVKDATHRYALRVFHDAGVSLDVESVQWMWEFKSD